ncbi:uncharacterized protein LOC123376672 isoform X2 [Mauremys mutica]|uniref:uncharacterized protein LOC123376672 isoform X2 n=1 Tax=Mauremys mutica TaxID=74926 RepID=UPI001D1650DC|nr:uncharacterized protein LOC123376672 isoform X2 [Mauremys mutica]
MHGFCMCTCRGSIQEPQAEQKLAEVDLISLSILLSRHEQSFPFCLPLNLVWAPSEYETSPEQVFYCIAHLTRRQQDVLWVVAVTSAGRSNISAKPRPSPSAAPSPFHG